MRNAGVLFQSGALWSSMTLAENIALPLQQYTDLGNDEIRELASLKLALVGLSGFEDYYPSEIRRHERLSEAEGERLRLF